MIKEELSYQEFVAVEKFAQDLKGCYEARLKEYADKTDVISLAIKATLQYVINILDLHLQFAELNFRSYDLNIAQSSLRKFDNKMV
jgi:hypothetical protein